jgi:hypothetical protein
MQEERQRRENMEESTRYTSDNNKTVALAQIQGMSFALQQASLDREMQLAANLTLGIEKLDTRLQETLLQYRMEMTAEENRHVEAVAQLGVMSAGRSDSPSSDSGDFPTPEEF